MPISNPRPGDVVGLPYPFSDRPAEKFRPALIVCAHEAGTPFRLIWAVMITSARGERWTGDIPISDLAAAGLQRASIIRPLKLVTIETSRVEWIAGRVASEELAACLTWIGDRLRPQ